MKEIDKKFDKVRCNLYIPSEIVEEVDAMSKTYGASRSVMVSFILKTYLDQQKVVNLAKLVPPQE
jgi:metal-responsive CopG/Arc/MetJ family transcriptional regulator